MGEGEVARLVALAEGSRRQFVDAIETLADGFALYDEDDCLVLCNEPFQVERQPLRLGLTIGICRFAEQSNEPEEIIHRADRTM